jgi:hypothetical protein
MAALAGALTLLSASPIPVAADPDVRPIKVASGGIMVTEAQINRLRGVLRLSAAQERYWHALENALRDVAGRGPVAPGSPLVGRVAHAAKPLVRILDKEQRWNALMMVRSLGLESVLLAYQ